MGKDRFDFSEIDAALPAAERMQEKDRLTDALENNYKAVGILSGKVEKLESRLSEILPGLDETVSSLRGASKITMVRTLGGRLSRRERRFAGKWPKVSTGRVPDCSNAYQ